MDQKIFAALALAVAVAGCMPDSPHTALDWGVNTTKPQHVAAKGPSKTYVYEEMDIRPTPRPSPNSVARNVPPRSRVTRQALAPVAAGDAPPAANPPPASDAPAFVWPVSGRVIADFGATANGGRNDGINIAAAEGTPIRAAASGSVSYAGDELRNYGNLVLIKHSGGFTTAYAHADRLVVSRGDFVAKGQVIGYAGQTGDVSQPQLHFEIRSGTAPVNPRSYLTSTTAMN